MFHIWGETCSTYLLPVSDIFHWTLYPSVPFCLRWQDFIPLNISHIFCIHSSDDGHDILVNSLFWLLWTIFKKKHFLFIWKRDSPNHCFIPQLAANARAGQVQTQVQELLPSLTYVAVSHVLPQAQYLRPEQVPIWDAGIIGAGFNVLATMLATLSCCFKIFI